VPDIGWPGPAFGGVMALGGFFRSIFDISCYLFARISQIRAATATKGNRKRRSPQTCPDGASAPLPPGRLLPTVSVERSFGQRTARLRLRAGVSSAVAAFRRDEHSTILACNCPLSVKEVRERGTHSPGTRDARATRNLQPPVSRQQRDGPILPPVRREQ